MAIRGAAGTVMRQAVEHISRAERHARRFAAELARNKISLPTPELEDYLNRFPEDVLIALEGFVEHVAAVGTADPLTIGHLIVVQLLLERIRYRSDRRYEDAIQLIETFQHAVAKLALGRRIDGQALSMLAAALHQAGIAASAELSAAMTE